MLTLGLGRRRLHIGAHVLFGERETAPADAERLFGEALDILEDAQSSVLVEQLRTGALSRSFASSSEPDVARANASSSFGSTSATPGSRLVAIHAWNPFG